MTVGSGRAGRRTAPVARARRCVVTIAALAVALIVFAGCRVATRPSTFGPTVVLVSLDAFRWDYFDRYPTPALHELARDGVRAERLTPSFPTKTFPNHYTIVTGLYPADHGIVANNMFDPNFHAVYKMWNRMEVEDGRWYGGEPIWVTAQKVGMRSAPYFWPGSEAPIDGMRPTYWRKYDQDATPNQRVDWVLSALDLPANRRPAFLTLYLSNVDDAGHDYGPGESPGLAAAVSVADHAVGRLLDGLRRRGLTQQVDVIVVSDHGMAPISPDRVVFIDDYVDVNVAKPVDWSPVLAMWPDAKDLDTVDAALRHASPHLHVWRRDEIPARLHFSGSRRIAPLIGLADEGWSIGTHEDFRQHPEHYRGGNHGYDNALVSMGALFVARGPHFRQGVTVPPFVNVDIYDVMCDVLGLQPAPNDGDPATAQELLQPSD
jgi:predicted AlkP superfamily pyrophosphatase or phosphodiesterase